MIVAHLDEQSGECGKRQREGRKRNKTLSARDSFTVMDVPSPQCECKDSHQLNVQRWCQCERSMCSGEGEKSRGGLSVSLMQTICLAMQNCRPCTVTGYYNTNRVTSEFDLQRFRCR